MAGRTDRGVHAWAQVASYAHEAVDPLRLNGLLDDDIAVLAAEPMQETFDARRDATSRTYCYRVLARRSRGVFERGRAFWWPGSLDREALAECAAALARQARLHGVHADARPSTRGFTARCGARSGWRRGICWSSGSRRTCSCRHMNRVLVGTMLEVAERTADGR